MSYVAVSGQEPDDEDNGGNGPAVVLAQGFMIDRGLPA